MDKPITTTLKRLEKLKKYWGNLPPSIKYDPMTPFFLLLEILIEERSK